METYTLEEINRMHKGRERVGAVKASFSAALCGITYLVNPGLPLVLGSAFYFLNPKGLRSPVVIGAIIGSGISFVAEQGVRPREVFVGESDAVTVVSNANAVTYVPTDAGYLPLEDRIAAVGDSLRSVLRSSEGDRVKQLEDSLRAEYYLPDSGN